MIGWSTSEAYTGNVTFLDGQPLTVTSLAGSIMDSGYTGNAEELKGTGFEGYGGTTWFTVQAQVMAAGKRTDLRIALVAETLGDAREVMIDGASGLARGMLATVVSVSA